MPIYTVELHARIEAASIEEAENMIQGAICQICNPLDIPDVTAEIDPDEADPDLDGIDD